MKKMLERARVRLIHRLGGMDREKIDLESEKAVRFEVEQNGQHRGARLRASVYVAVTD